MDLREKVSLTQKVAEYSIRFRLIEVIIAILFCIIALLNIDGVLISLQPLSEQMEKFLVAFVLKDFSAITKNSTIVFVALLLFIFRWKFFGFKCSLLWFFFLFFNCFMLIIIGESKNIMEILLACVLIIATTCFFFIRSLFVKSILPLIFLVYSLSAWLLFLGISNLAWFGLVSVFFADVFHLIFVISYKICKSENKKNLTGAIAHGVQKTIPVSLLTIILLVITELVFYFMGLPLLASKNLLHSIAIYICYAIWMPFFTAAVFSFCPLENTCERMQKKSK